MTLIRRSLLLSPLVLAAGHSAAQTAAPEVASPKPIAWPKPSHTIDLWPDMSERADLKEVVEETSTNPDAKMRRVKGISKPRLAVFPVRGGSKGAMLIIPGGGFSWNYFDHEGYTLALFLNSLGITCFVLFYRLANDGIWDNRADVGLIDAQRAIRVIRRQAGEYRFDPERVGVTGFSAGGFLAASLATRHHETLYDGDGDIDARPCLAAPIYPVQTLDPAFAYEGAAPSLFGGPATAQQIAHYSPENRVDERTPPMFLCHAEDDRTVPVENSTRLRDALKAKGIPVETHLFATGGHGFGFKMDYDYTKEQKVSSYSSWTMLFGSFLYENGFAP